MSSSIRSIDYWQRRLIELSIIPVRIDTINHYQTSLTWNNPPPSCSYPLRIYLWFNPLRNHPRERRTVVNNSKNNETSLVKYRDNRGSSNEAIFVSQRDDFWRFNSCLFHLLHNWLYPFFVWVFRILKNTNNLEGEVVHCLPRLIIKSFLYFELHVVPYFPSRFGWLIRSSFSFPVGPC